MVQSLDLLKAMIKAHIEETGGDYSDWYVGISEDPKNRLDQHNVSDENFPRTWDTESEQRARDIEDYFVNVLETQGDTGGGDRPTYVYVYKTSHHTNEAVQHA